MKNSQPPVSSQYTDYYRLSWGLVQPPPTFTQSLLASLPATILLSLVTLIIALYVDAHQNQLERGIIAALIIMLGTSFIIAFNFLRYRIVQSFGPKLIKCSLTQNGIKAKGRRNIPWDQVNHQETLKQLQLPPTPEESLIISLKRGHLKLRFTNQNIRTQITNSLTHYLNQTKPSS